MKQNRIFYALFIVIALCTACADSIKEEPVVGDIPTQGMLVKYSELTAGFDSDQTRTYVENGAYLRWHEADAISAFVGNTGNNKYIFNGATGDNSGTFSLDSLTDPQTGEPIDRIYAVYPYSSTNVLSTDGVVTLSYPSSQTYLENSFGRDASVMVAATASTSDTFLSFKNGCGWLCLKLYNINGANLSSITLEGNNGEKISGEAYISMDEHGEPIVHMGEDAYTTIKLDANVKLGKTAEEAIAIWIALPPTTFSNGIKVTAFDSTGKVFEKSTTNEVVVERNHIQPMVALEATFEKVMADNEIWYTSKDGKVVTPTQTSGFGAEIVSNTYTDGLGVIKFDGPVTMVGYNAFYNNSTIKSIILPSTVTEIDDRAFFYSSLESITINDGVTRIGDSVFSNSRLGSIVVPNSVTEIGTFAFSTGTLSEVTLGSGLTEIGRIFYQCDIKEIVIPDSVTAIREQAFEDCSSLKKVVLGKGVKTVEPSAFFECDQLEEFYGDCVTEDHRYVVIDGELVATALCGLTEIVIPAHVTKIARDACAKVQNFALNSPIERIVIHDEVTTIGAGAFANNITKSLYLGKKVNQIGTSAFTQYPNRYIERVDISDIDAWCRIEFLKNETGAISYSSTPVENGTKVYLNGELITDVVFPTELNEVGQMTFMNWKQLNSVELHDGITSIGDSAFKVCTSLKSVSIPQSVTSIGSSAFQSCTSIESINIPSGVKTISYYTFSSCGNENVNIIISDGVEVIRNSAFHGSRITSIIIPASVKEIHYDAFNYCSNLSSVYCMGAPASAINWSYGNAFENNAEGRKIYVPGAYLYEYTKASGWSKYSADIEIMSTSAENTIVYTTSDNKALTISQYADFGASILSHTYNNGQGEITFSQAPTKIGGLRMFEDQTTLTSISLPESITSIGDKLSSSSNLASVKLSNKMTVIPAFAFYGCSKLIDINIPDSLIEIGKCAFDGCSQLKSITLPQGVTAIGDSAFDGCSALQSVDLPATLATIGEAAFYECKSLASITIPDGVTEIKYNTFAKCSSLNSVEIGSGVAKIGQWAFNECIGITSLTIPGNVKTLGEGAFINCTNLASLTIESGVTTIGIKAFQVCPNIKKISIPGSVTTIEDDAFYECTNTAEITLEEGIKSIGESAFWGSKYLNTITIPASVTSIGKYAFWGYNSVASIKCLSTTPPSISETTFNVYSTSKIYVPEGCINAYKSHSGWSKYWSEYGDIFVENVSRAYTLNLNNNWRKSTSISNPNSSLYDGVYESYSNYNVNSTGATMYIDIAGYETFKLYVRSYAESNYDYVMVSQLDATITNSTSYGDSNVKTHTRGAQSSGTDISYYKLVEFTGIDKGKHRITIVYHKDGSTHSGQDRGYILIPKQ